MIVLGVDTSTVSLTVSVIDEKKILAAHDSAGAFRHSALLMPVIKKVLKKGRIGIDDIGLFSIGIGPGSFTGLRVGITAVRALAIALDKPLIGIPTIDAVAYNGLAYLKKAKLLDGHAKVCPVLDAKRKQVYACIYGHDGADIRRETGYLLEPAGRLVRRLKGTALFLGDAVPLYKKELSHKRGFKTHFLDGESWMPKASVIAKMALEAYNKGKRDNPYDLVPLYLYARDCQVTKRGQTPISK